MSFQHYAGASVEMSPVKTESGAPMRMQDPNNPAVTHCEVFVVKDRDTREDRAVLKRRISTDGYTVTNPETAESVGFFWEDLYRRPDGSLYHHRVEASEGMQTVGRYEASGGGKQRDLYLSKPGWRYAVAADVLAAIAKAESNGKAQEARARAKDPLEANKAMAAAITGGLAAALKEQKRGGTQ